MILLDTNVLSEPLKAAPDPQVLAWLDAQAPGTLFLSTITLAELWSGVERLPAGRRRDQLELALAQQVLPLFTDRVLDFDMQAARVFAQLMTSALAEGFTPSFADAAIAAIARARGFTVASRNVNDFRGMGVVVLNPWEGVRARAVIAT